MYKIATPFIKKWEGFSSTPYYCPAWKLTVGYGVVILRDGIYAGHEGQSLLQSAESLRKVHKERSLVNKKLAEQYKDFMTEEQASRLLEQKLREFWRDIRDDLPHGLKDHQCAAILSLAYNIGTGAFKRSTLLHFLKQGNFTQVIHEFMRWRFVRGVELTGLRARRIEEAKLFKNE